jgi:hypothetical protein
VSFVGTAVFLLAPLRQGLGSNERRKKRKIAAGGFERKFIAFFKLQKEKKRWLRGD